MAEQVEQVSPELKALQSQFSYLVSCISVSSILPEARSKVTAPNSGRFLIPDTLLFMLHFSRTR